MIYYQIWWPQDSASFPEQIIYEADERRLICKAVRYFKGGAIEYISDKEASSSDVILPDVSLGKLEEYQNEEMWAEEISKEVFDAIWNAAKSGQRVDNSPK